MKNTISTISANYTLTTATTAEQINALVSAFVANIDVADSTPRTYKKSLTQFFDYLEASGRSIATTDKADIIAFKKYLQDNDYKPTTINSYLTAIRQFCKFCGCADMVEGVKSAKIGSTYEKGDFTKEQAAAIVANVQADGNRRDIAIINVLLRCGLRTIEASRAKIGDIALQGNTYVLRVVGKGSKIRFVPLTATTWQAINDYLTHDRRGAKDTEPLFASDAHQSKGGHLSTATISRLCKKYIRSIGINDSRHTAHSLRHTTAGLIYEQTHDLDRIQTLLGHSDPATTQIYAKMAMQRDFMNHAPNAVIDTLF